MKPSWAVPTWLGDIPTWLGVFAATAAGVVGFLLYLRESKRDELAEERRLAELHDARQAQADKIAAWYSRVEEYLIPEVRGVFNRRYGAFIGNASDLPVYDVRVTFYYVHHPDTGASEWHPIDRGRAAKELRVIPPQEREFVDIPADIEGQVQDSDEHSYVVGIEFRDAAGSRWKRDAHGQLEEL